ncbi:T9SS type A sorting domain-containing protein [Corallibacter sp.]|uniref:T9SS type A sorting domain-containing protein n=1 Tax=Corallibacter sp. TaxID=2038084 RepID=UPI003AB22633
MKKLYFLLFALTACFTFGQNIAVNGGFETWSTGVLGTWSSESGTTITQETTTVAEGSFAANFEVTTASQGDTDFRQSISVVAGVVYNVSVQIYQLDNGSRARLYAGDYRNYSDESLLNQWQTVSYEYTADATGDVEFGLRFYDISANFTGSSVMIVDDFRVEAQTTPSIAVLSPADNSTVVSGDVDIELSIQNFIVANGTGDGHIHYTVDGGGIVMKYDTDPISLTGLADGEHTVDLELVNNSHASFDPAITTSVTFTVSSVTQVADLAALRADVATNGTGGFYEIMSTPTITYTRTNRNQKYAQDTSGTGILIDDSAGTITTTFAIGDGISGLVGQTSEFNGVLQFVPSADASVAVGATVTPEVVTIATLLTNWEDYESKLIQINQATFFDAGSSFAASADYDLMDTSSRGGVSIINFRTNFAEADYIGETIPSGANDIVVFVGEFGGSPQVTARSLTDLTLSRVNFNANNEFNIYPNPVTNGTVNISSSSNEAIKVAVYDILGKQVLNNTLTNNTLNVSSLNSGVYILRLSQNNNTVSKKLIIK